MIQTEQLQGILDGNGVVQDESGTKVGKIGQIYLDDESGRPEWVSANTGLFGTSETFVPLRDATLDGANVTVPYSKDMIKDAPRIDDEEGHLSPEQETELYRYYGLESGGDTGDRDHDSGDLSRGTDDRSAAAGVGAAGTAAATGGGRDTGHDTSGPDTDDAMTRSEEQVRVGTERQQSGRARLRKFITTEHVSQTVPVQHEEARVVREPITDANRGDAMAGGDLTEEEHEMTLSQERVVVDKETVPVERVRMDKDVVTDQEQVETDVRSEQIEVDTDDAGRTDSPDTSRTDRDRGRP